MAELDSGQASAGPAVALDGVTVIDLAGYSGNYCSKLFRDLGADVILVEPPGGSDVREEPPFDPTGSGESLSFAYLNSGKRSVALDLTREEDRGRLHLLVRRADVVIDGRTADQATMAGVDYDTLSALNPALVLTSITPFGLTGPWAEKPATDLTLLALGGLMYLGGYADGPPVRAVRSQAYMAGGLFGAVGAMLALTAAEATGVGEHVDVSIQESVTMGLENAAQFFDMEGTIRRRSGGGQWRTGSGTFPCRDGHVYLLAGGIGGNRFWPNMVNWLKDESVAGAELLDGEKWNERGFQESAEGKDTFAAVFGTYAQETDSAKLYRLSQQWRVPLCPVSDPHQILASRQFADRGYFVPLGMAKAPGAPYRLSGTPWRGAAQVPAVGEHTEKVFAGAGTGSR